MEKVLEIKGITKRFGRNVVFNNVNLDLYRGEILAMVGENGAGKSTMMNILSGVYPTGQYEGEFFVNGKKAGFRNEHDAKLAGIEMVHQEISLHLDLSIAENLFMGNLSSRHGVVSWKEVYRSAVPYLERVNLKVDPREEVRNLSSSQQQLLSIAKALACNPKIILLDEPTSALTEADADNLIEIVRKLAAEGISCIYVSHRLEEVFSIADRISVLRDGNLISTRKCADATVDQVIEDMVGRSLGEMYNKQTDIPIGDVVLEARDITVSHPFVLNRNIVENISFSVRRGEILGFSGLVGSGRSETMCAMYGYMKKEGGELLLEGKPISIRRPDEAIAHGIGMVSEDRKRSGIIGPMSIRENISIASLKEISKRAVISNRAERKLAETYYQKLHIRANGIEDNILNLSGGNQQKVVLAKWLAKDIKVLVLDEPTRGVDVSAKIEIYNIIYELARRGVAVIVVSSELNELLGICDRIMVLARGKVWGNLERKDFTQERIMRAATCIEAYGVAGE